MQRDRALPSAAERAMLAFRASQSPHEAARRDCDRVPRFLQHVPFDPAREFFVKVEAMRFQTVISPLASVCFESVGVTVDGAPVPTTHSQWNDLVQRSPAEFQPPLWRVFLDRASTFSSTNASAFNAYVFIDVAELHARVRLGECFPGRRLLYQAVVNLGLQELRVPHCIMHFCAQNTSKYTLKQHLGTVFDVARAADGVGATDANLIGSAVAAAAPAGEAPAGEAPLGCCSARCKTELFDFQRRSVERMVELERTGVVLRQVASKYMLIASDEHEVWMAFDDTFRTREECEHVSVRIRGGFLTDAMGMGKTLTMLSVCMNNPVARDVARRRPAATLIICPSHVVQHWVQEVDKHTDMRRAVVTTKAHMEELTFERVMCAERRIDFVIMSFNIFNNPHFKSCMEYYSCSTPKRPDAFIVDFERRPLAEQRKQRFVPHIYDWGRVVIDEFHEMGHSTFPTICSYVLSVRAASKWLVSGTPVVNAGLFRFTVPSILMANPGGLLAHEAVLKVVPQLNVRSAHYDVQIPGVREKVIRVDLSKTERSIYEAMRMEGREQQIRVCSYARLAKVVQRQAHEVHTLEEMDRIVQSHLQQKLAQLQTTIAETQTKVRTVRVLVADETDRSREACYLRELLQTARTLTATRDEVLRTISFVQQAQATTCAICLEEMELPSAIKHCGHRLCNACLRRAVDANPTCPICRTPYGMSDVIQLVQEEDEDGIISRYGSKLYHLVEFLKGSSSVKTLVFSQWDDLLKDVGRCIETLCKGRHRVLYCQGNVMQKQNAIKKFKTHACFNLMLLSTLNSGSGCDLSVAQRVILLDAIDGSGAFATGIEQQAISRCHRIGQKGHVEVVRFIARHTIEEELHDAGR